MTHTVGCNRNRTPLLSKASNVVQNVFFLCDVTGFAQMCHLSPVATNCKSNDKTRLASRWGRHHPFSQFFACRLTLFSTLVRVGVCLVRAIMLVSTRIKAREGDAQPLLSSFITQPINTPCPPQQTCIALDQSSGRPRLIAQSTQVTTHCR